VGDRKCVFFFLPDCRIYSLFASEVRGVAAVDMFVTVLEIICTPELPLSVEKPLK
jgi:hypothetical protein